MTLIIKNTFLHITEDGSPCSTSTRRSSSTPPDWRTPTCGQPISEASTPTSAADIVSDDEARTSMSSECEVSGELSDCETVLTQADWTAEVVELVPPKVTLNLHDHIDDVADRCKVPAQLSGKARAFTPSGLPLGEAGLIVMALQRALSMGKGVTNVEMSKGGGVGSTIAFIAQTAEGASAGPVIGAAKAAIFAASALSSTVYLVGYLANPFQDRYEVRCTGFKVTLGFVPRALEDSVCWDTIQKGFCPRRSTCRWCHPSESELVKLSVMVLTQ